MNYFVYSMHFFHLTRNENRLTQKTSLPGIENEPTLHEIFEKVSILLFCPTVLSEELVVVDDDNVSTGPIMAIKGILELSKARKNLIDANSGDEN
ncbi:hypothetical protein TNCV_799961 [Trichonephila clavipes]|nr:hypothetical protein TNCV_799961 [Trichonephila clavipes]